MKDPVQRERAVKDQVLKGQVRKDQVLKGQVEKDQVAKGRVVDEAIWIEKTEKDPTLIQSVIDQDGVKVFMIERKEDNEALIRCTGVDTTDQAGMGGAQKEEFTEDSVPQEVYGEVVQICGGAQPETIILDADLED